MGKVSISEIRQRGEYEEIVVLDLTRVSHPVTARILRLGGDYLVVPEKDAYPIVLRDNLDAAISFVERILP